MHKSGAERLHPLGAFMTKPKRKIVFFAEGATLAHVARPFSLAESLDQEKFNILFARPSSFTWLTATAKFPLADLRCQDGEIFAKKLDRGTPLYDLATLERYVADDLALIDREKPDIVVGDFRLSLAVSARIRKVPYITICDAYWSPESKLTPELPVMPWTPYVPLPLALRLFGKIAPIAMELHAAPMERLRARHGIPPINRDIRLCYSDADIRLFANFPSLFPSISESKDAEFIGPLAWSPPTPPLLDWQLQNKEIIYVSMGSSGDTTALRSIVEALETLPYPVLITTAGKPVPANLCSSKTRIFDYFPGHLACEKAILVICNGGSPTTNQALTRGTPVLGVTKNMDQFLNMRTISEFGAGLSIRADRATQSTVRHSVESLLGNAQFALNAAKLAHAAKAISTRERFAAAINRLLD